MAENYFFVGSVLTLPRSTTRVPLQWFVYDNVATMMAGSGVGDGREAKGGSATICHNDGAACLRPSGATGISSATAAAAVELRLSP